MVKDSLSPQTINGGFCSLAGWDSHAAPAQVQASVTHVLTHGTLPDHPMEVSNEIPPTPHKVRNPKQRPPSPGSRPPTLAVKGGTGIPGLHPCFPPPLAPSTFWVKSRERPFAAAIPGTWQDPRTLHGPQLPRVAGPVCCSQPC